MNAARAYRRLKEVEEQKLQNRLALLKMELERSTKKISETKTRTERILHHRQSIMEKHQEKLRDLVRKEEELQMHVELNTKARERLNTLRRANMMNVHKQKKEEAKQVIEERLRNEQMIERQRKLELERAAEVKKLIRDQRIAGQEARNAELERKRNEARQEFQRRLAFEAMRSQTSESKVSEMEAMELELIQKLEAAQEMQRNAYKELETALITSKATILEVSKENMKLNAVNAGRPQRTPRRRKSPRGHEHGQDQHAAPAVVAN